MVLVRHADAAGLDAEDGGLSELGRHQARQLAEALAELDVGAVWHGPKRRAEETARVVETVVGCERLPSDRLDDRTPFPVEGRWAEYPRDRWEWFAQVPVEERDPGGVVLSEAWAYLCSQEHPSETLVAITHSFVIAWFVSLALEGTSPTWTHIAVSNAAITEIEHRPDGQLIVHRVNDTAHLSR